MTSDEFEALKAKFAYCVGRAGNNLSERLALGYTSLHKECTKLDLQRVYMDILLDYVLYAEDASDYDNIFTVDEMQDIISRLNKLCGTYYNADLILET